MAKTYVVKLEVDGITESVNSINSLETAVSDLENELKNADLGSAEFKQLSEELGVAKGELEGFQRGIDALDPAAKAEQFVKFGEGIAGGFAVATGAMSLMGTESEEMEKLMVNAQGAVAIAVGIRSIAEAKLTQTIANSAIAEKAKAIATVATTAVTKLATGGMKLFRAALLTTGIGAFVVAAGLLVAYWEDIKKLVTGVNEADKKLLETSKELIVQEELKLEILKETEDTLRLQGLTEREIRDRKREQVQSIIDAKKEDLELQSNTIQFQIDAEARNQKIAAGIIAFMTLPITSMMAAVDALTYGLEKIGVLEEATSFAEDFAMGAASFLFDPEDLEAESEALRIETERALGVLENTKAGYLLQNKKQDEQSAQARIDAAKAEAATLAELKKTEQDSADADDLEADAQEAQDFLDAENKLKTEAEQLRALTEELALMAIDEDYKRAQKELELQEQRDLEAIEDADNYEAQKLAIEQKYTNLSKDLKEEKAKSDIEIAQSVADAEDAIDAARINNIGNGFKLLSQAAGENRAAQAIAIIGENAVGIAKQIISTKAANTAIIAQGAALAIPSGGASKVAAAALVTSNNIGLGLGIAGSVLATKKALSSLKAGGDAGDGGAAEGGGDAGGGGGWWWSPRLR